MTPEEELHLELRHVCRDSDLEFENSSDRYFVLLEQRFPVSGSKIDWSRTTASIDRKADLLDSERYVECAKAFAAEVFEAQGFDLKTRVVVIGDSAMEGAIVMSLETLRSCLRSFLLMPQHTYVTNAEASWCMVFTMEGDLSFGRAMK